MHERFAQLIQALFAPEMPATPEVTWRPAADVYRCRRGWLVKVELAGVRPEDVQARVDGRHLSISGTRRDWSVQQSQQTHLMEIEYSKFERVIEFPETIADAELQTEYRDGMLLISITTEADGT